MVDSKYDAGKWKIPTAKEISGQVPQGSSDANCSDLAKDQMHRHGQAGRADVPMKGELPAQTGHILRRAVAPHVPAKESPKTAETPAQVIHEPRGDEAETLQPQRGTAIQRPDTAAMEAAVRAGKQALSTLNQLARGGKKTAPAVFPAPATVQDRFRQALINQLARGSKNPAQPGKEVAKLPEKDMQTAIVQDDKDRVRHPGERVIEKNMVEAIAQNIPFAADRRIARRDDERKREIRTERAAELGLKDVEEGKGIEGVARARMSGQEFSGSGFQGAFADYTYDFSAGPKGITSGVVPLVYGEEGRAEAAELCRYVYFSSNVLNGGRPVVDRVRDPVGDRITNTSDDVALSKRLGDARYLMQAAFGTRGSVYGPGKMVG